MMRDLIHDDRYLNHGLVTQPQEFDEKKNSLGKPVVVGTMKDMIPRHRRERDIRVGGGGAAAACGALRALESRHAALRLGTRTEGRY